MTPVLHDALFKLLGVHEGSRLQEKIINSSRLLIAGVEGTECPPKPAAVIDLWSSEVERRTVAERQLASIWIAAKFWGSSLQRVSLSTLVTDLLYRFCVDAQQGSEGVCAGSWNDTMEMVNRLHEAEMVLLRRQRFVVPGVSVGIA
ncbi:hypothetical protein, conserved [Trypanosoma brucei gambiense DAL972]|uniref:Uncharacterized protein n=3 Tax=Trypanosoma brucei TaxID=5691 RepID=Q385F0_TRYB2|nr:hypothetical protein, conserved [Trypanosoma brucei gambiense DAL972]XP_828693.1 hypothetical protein, conserved [Trypanosoma brucei brucei TREU927]RHW67075.1 hypothetical protein DPX39_000042700 [Trypanosoma brucei equiperdum]EAN79581.1 hypothetical protein, conserved [Trypanosoma brucei brucei TREU927]RHW67107.1 hypothetical protein DPX39_000042500 [Trypanosoma brucei equiperdum]CBH17580.1 hypothetical protein, conserved [Trypanosoma brucei gambiense DAL972]|eukprot:XP_011779844.1 hypothetical protein, conserved [Trypanosoma brucei gambiense DAL972]